MGPRLEAVIRAAIEVTSIAFVDQDLTVGTRLHGPMQRLMDALDDYPPHRGVLRRINDEMVARARSMEEDEDHG